MPSLADVATTNPKIRKILEDPKISHRDAERWLYRDFGVATSEASVRRARKALEEGRPAPVQAAPKDMPTFMEYEGPNGRAALFLPREGVAEEDLLRQAGFDPDAWRISGAVNCRKWMRYDQEWLFYYKFDAEQGESEGSRQAHIEDLVKRIRKRSPHQPKFVGITPVDQTYVIVMSDWQIGKSEQGRGSADTVERWKDCLAQARKDIIRLRKSGVVIDNLAVISVGDLVEGCGDHYDMQTFLVDLDRRNQCRVVREMLTETLLTLVPMFNRTVVACVGGNHGENRRKGKAFTTFADNDDVATVEAVKEAFDLSEWKNFIEWHIPDEELSQVVWLSGIPVGLVHGHQFRGGVNVLKKSETWWRDQDFGMEVVRDAQILVSGHFHFDVLVNVTHNRTWMQGPTIDPGSKWYTDASGNSAIPGVLTFVVTPESPVGYDYRRVLHPADTAQVS